MGTEVIKKFLGTLNKNSPVILTGLGVTGLVATTIMAVKATPKALQILEDEKNNRSENGNYDSSDWTLTAKDIIKLTWKCYMPAAIMGVVTIACIVRANSINLRRNAALVGVYSLSETALKEYRSKVVETIGKGAERKIKDEIAKDRVTNNPISDKEVVITGVGESLCYDALSGRYFKSDIEHIRQALNKLSRDLMSEQFITLNEVYGELDLKSTKMGDVIGWHIDDGLIEPDFSSQLTENGMPCLVLDYMTGPRYNYNDY
jgi:hypothetical protein